MKISFERSGGFGGIRLGGTLVTESLKPEEAQQLDEIIKNSGLLESSIKSYGRKKTNAASWYLS